jgi:transposase
MYLRRHRRRKRGEDYDYWTLVESVRTARGPRQRIVAHIGKEPGLDEDDRLGWEHIGKLLDGQEDEGKEQLDLFAAEKPEAPLWAQVNLRGVRVERVRQFGKVYVALALWRRLGLHRFFEKHLPVGRESVGWSQVASILSVGRFCEQVSELALAERWYASTALEDLIGVDVEAVYDNRLYRGLDRVLPLRSELFDHLRERYARWFGSRFEFLIYDITSTYFEGQCADNRQAQRGYSRDKRPDCKQVCIGLVVTTEGLPLAYEVFEGNRADVTTVEEMVELMENHYGVADRIWVLDRGMVSEDNLDYLCEKKARYLVGTPKSQLKSFGRELLEQSEWSEVQAGVEVKLVAHPDRPEKEQYVLCRSRARRDKEAAMLQRQQERLRNKLEQIDAGLRKRPQRPDRVERRIGRWLGRNTMVERIFSVEVQTDAKGRACALTFSEDTSKADWAQRAHGAYLLRTNVLEEDPRKLWRWYIQLTQAEDAFRCSKSDLGLRPLYHHKEDRVQAHILICFIALVMWRTLENWLQSKGLGSCARQVLHELDNLRSMDVVAPLRGGRQARLRLVGKPERLCSELLKKMDLKLPVRPKIVQNVVQENGSR